MKASKQAGKLIAVLSAAMVFGGVAHAAKDKLARLETPPIPEGAKELQHAEKITPPEPGLYALGDLSLAPGMTLYIFRSATPTRQVEIGRMKVLEVAGTDVKLELVSGSSAMRSGDHLEVEASSPSEWAPYAEGGSATGAQSARAEPVR